jgi:cytochrome c peroxidase
MKTIETSNPRRVWLLPIVISVATALATSFAAARDDSDDASLLKEARTHFKPLPKEMATTEFPVTPARVELGRKLFFDPRFSIDGAVSCSRCHLPALFGADALPKSVGVHGNTAPRNAPTVLNTGLNFKIHWDGQFANPEEQAKQALLGAFGNPDFAAAIARVKSIAGYAEMFQQAFPGEAEPVSADNCGKAIGAYERTLISPSRFDEYLGGKSGALSPAQRKGLRTFIDTGCVNCHKGAGAGGLSFRKFGEVSEYWKATGSQNVDKGRFGVTNDPADLYKFKVPALRNVAMTAPYFHDGSVNALPKAVQIMAKVQLDVDLSDAEVNDIVAFLGSLTGSLPEGFERAPLLPAGGFGSPSSTPSVSPPR